MFKVYVDMFGDFGTMCSIIVTFGSHDCLTATASLSSSMPLK
jgi:hypothetical protein